MKASALLRQVRAPAVVTVVYLILRALFDAITEHGGLISPGGSVNAGVAVLGAVVIVLRLVVLFVVPALVAYRLVAAVARLLPPAGSGTRNRGA